MPAGRFPQRLPAELGERRQETRERRVLEADLVVKLAGGQLGS